MAPQQLPPWTAPVVIGSSVGVLFLLAFVLNPPASWSRVSTVAFVGNSMQYYNDLPRFMEALSGQQIIQNSCLHGDATIVNLLQTGNGMVKKFHSGNAYMANVDQYDYGACTVHQLVFGHDSNLKNSAYDDDDNDNDPYDDGTNPCYEDANYLQYTQEYFESNPPHWEFIVINDNTRSPAKNSSRLASLEALESTYASWFNQTGAIPVFLDTHAYWTDWRDMTGLVDVPTFTSYVYEGYRQYAQLLSEVLEDEQQQPRIAPVGIAFLTVWEENYAMWLKLFHIDEVHASPSGTFLTGCILHYTLLGRMPRYSDAIRDNMSSLWRDARRLQPTTHKRNPFPTRNEAEYLYRVAERVVKEGHRPYSFIQFTNGEAAPDTSDNNDDYNNNR